MRAGPSSFSRLGHLVHVEEASGERYEELEIVSGEWFRVEPLGEREGLTIQTRNFLGKPRVLAIDRHTGRIAQILRLVSLGFQKLPKPSRNLVVQFPNGLQDAFLGHLLPLDFFKKGCCLEKAQLQLQVSRDRANVGAEDLVILWGACHEKGEPQPAQNMARLMYIPNARRVRHKWLQNQRKELPLKHIAKRSCLPLPTLALPTQKVNRRPAHTSEHKCEPCPRSD